MWEPKFKLGDRVRTTRADSIYYPVGAVGTIVATASGGDWYVAFDPWQDGVRWNHIDYLTCVVRNIDRVWIVTDSGIELEDPLIAGENGWVPDRLRHDIDVLEVTRELVSVQVGK